MENLIIIVILVALVGGAAYYIYKAKKKGEGCIGCPHAKTCQKNKCSVTCSDADKDNSQNEVMRGCSKSRV